MTFLAKASTGALLDRMLADNARRDQEIEREERRQERRRQLERDIEQEDENISRADAAE